MNKGQRLRDVSRGGAAMFVLWARHDKGPTFWLPIVRLRGQAAVDELAVRQDRVRRSGQPCQFRLLPDGESPDGRVASSWETPAFPFRR